MSGRGLDTIPVRAPERWDPHWFERFIREVLALADARNAVEGPGVTITGKSDEPATISASVDLENLLAATLLTLTDSALDNAHTLTGEDGVIQIVDEGVTADIRLVENGVPAAKLEPVPTEKFAPVAELSVLGAQAGSDGKALVDQIASSSDDTIVRRTAGAIDFGTLTLPMAPDNLWTYGKLQQGTALSVPGVAGNAAADLADIVAVNDGEVLRRSGTSLGFGEVSTLGLASNAVTNAKLADMAEATIKGRQAAAGVGDPENLTAAQVKTILGLVFSDIGGSVADAQVPETAVTQHQAALSIGYSQLSGTPEIPGGLSDYADDAAAATGGVPVNGLYRNGSVVQIRVA